jgi:hypothetical protein
MARYPIEALTSATQFVKQLPIDRVGDRIIQSALQRLWTYAPWAFSVASGTSITLEQARGSYDYPYPDNWLYALKAELSTNDLSARPLAIVSHIQQDDSLIGNPTKIAFTGPGGLVRPVQISPVPATLTGDPRISVVYKKKLEDYSGENIHILEVPFPDTWYWVFEELVLHEAYRYTDDRRAGDVTVQGDKTSMNGQLAVAYAGLIEMAKREPLVLLAEKNPKDVEA